MISFIIGGVAVFVVLAIWPRQPPLSDWERYRLRYEQMRAERILESAYRDAD